MQVSAKLISWALLPLLASLVPITFASFKMNPDRQLIQFMASFKNVRQEVDRVNDDGEHFSQFKTHYDRLNDMHDFNQRFYRNDQYYDGGPALLVIGGFEEFTRGYFRQPLWLEIAQRLKGVIYGLEHRCYGYSRPPFPSYKFLHFCNTEEALTDIAFFIAWINGTTRYSGLPWIVMGEGHGGRLAAWSKQKFAHFIVGAIAINAPLKAKLNFYEFFEDISMQLIDIDGVMETIQNAYTIIENDIQNDKIDAVATKLKLCDNILANPDIDVQNKNIQYMLWAVTWNLGLILELKDTKKEMYKTKVLEIFEKSSGKDPVEVLSNALEVILRYYHVDCLHADYEKLVDWFKNPGKYAGRTLPDTVKSGLGGREEYWQSCTEFGNMKTSTKRNMFGDVPLDFFIDLCKDIYGPSFDKELLINSIQTSNIFYNWMHIKTDHILFVNYLGNKYKQLFVTDYYFDNHDVKIVNISDIPDTPFLITEVRDTLREKYDEIYNYLKEIIEEEDEEEEEEEEKEYLVRPKVLAHRIPGEDDKYTDGQLIQFMISFMNVKYMVPGVGFRSGDFSQHVNNLDRRNINKYGQLHYITDQFYEDGGPALLILGGLAPFTQLDFLHPVWIELAQRSRAVLFALEHRCFGRSRPQLEEEEFLQLCSSEQQLYDITRFIGTYKVRFVRAKWIVIGESHGGKLAAWSRLKIPNLVDGAVAINAPLIPKKEFNEFYDFISYKLSRLGILAHIKAAYEIIAQDIDANRIYRLKDKLPLCTSPEDQNKEVQDKNIQFMFWAITWNLGIINILRNTKRKLYKTNIIEIFRNQNQEDPVKKLSDALQIILSRYDLECIPVNYQEVVDSLKKPDQQIHMTVLSGFGNRESFWQSCTEFGYMKTSTKHNMFGDVPLSFFIGLCADVFGPWYNENIIDKSIQTTKMFYNGNKIDASNILFINYIGDCERIFVHAQNNKKQEFEIVNITDVPEEPSQLTYHTRGTLTKYYNDIYDYLELVTGVTFLEPARITANRLPDIDEELIQTDDQLIQFMLSFKDVRQIVDGDKPRARKLEFPQEFDHLNRNTNDEHWKQTYYTSDKYHKENGPIILVIGELTALTEEYFLNPLWTEIAQRAGGVLFALEHRCYGDSFPLDVSDDKYLHLCNTEQQLYDIAHFIKTYALLYNETKWLVIGKSHGGKLAAWMRLKFPSIVDGAVVINAPLVPKKEFNEFFDHVSYELSKKPGIMNTIKDAYNQIAEDIKNDRLEQLTDKLKLCTNPADSEAEVQEKNIQYMLWSITWNLGTITKLKDTEEEKYKTRVLETLAGNSEKDPVQKLSDALQIILSQYDLDCTHVIYREAVNYLKTPNPTLDKQFVTLRTGFGIREALWQSCTEFGYMKTSTKENMFGDVKLDFFIGVCKDVFGPWYPEDLLDRSIKTTNMFYNGKNLKAGQIVFINYKSNIENMFAITDYGDHHDNIFIDIPDIPDDAGKLSITMSTTLRQRYDDIFEYLRVLLQINDLQSPKVVARRLPDVGDGKKNNKIETEKVVDATTKTEIQTGGVVDATISPSSQVTSVDPSDPNATQPQVKESSQPGEETVKEDVSERAEQVNESDTPNKQTETTEEKHPNEKAGDSNTEQKSGEPAKLEEEKAKVENVSEKGEPLNESDTLNKQNEATVKDDKEQVPSNAGGGSGVHPAEEEKQ